MTAPEVIWELFLGLWLTFKGFKPVPLGAGGTPDVRAGAEDRTTTVVAA
jgi:hypothetical protein